MNFIFFGGKAIGNCVLRGLFENNQIPLGIINYKGILDQVLIDIAKQKCVSILQIQTFRNQQKEILSFIKALKVDFYISVAFPFILSTEILNLVKYPINIHTGAIPKYRGHHPLSAAFLNDEPYQATTVHIMAEEVDAGDILLQDFIKVENEDTIISVRTKLSELSLRLVLIVIEQLRNGSLYPRSQIGEVIWAPKRNPEDSKIDFSKDSRYLHNFIRALVDPYPNAFAFRNSDSIKFKKSIVSNKPGIVLAQTGNKQYVISTGNGVVLVETDTELKVGDKLK